MSIDAAFLADRIAATQTSIINYEEAIAAISIHGIEEYKLDTGQNITTVRRGNLLELESALNAQYERLTRLCNRRNGAMIIGRPAF